MRASKEFMAARGAASTDKTGRMAIYPRGHITRGREEEGKSAQRVIAESSTSASAEWAESRSGKVEAAANLFQGLQLVEFGVKGEVRGVSNWTRPAGKKWEGRGKE
jgi:hypothetical protein